MTTLPPDDTPPSDERPLPDEARSDAPPIDAAMPDEASIDAAPSPGDVPPVRYRWWVTLLCTLALAGLLIAFLIDTSRNRIGGPRNPGPSIDRIVGRDLDLDAYLDRAGVWARILAIQPELGPEDTLDQAIVAYREFVTVIPSVMVRRTLVVLLAEDARWSEAERELARLATAGRQGNFIRNVRFAYAGGLGQGSGDRTPPSQRATDQSLQRVMLPWARDQLRRRLAAARGDAVGARAAEVWPIARGRRLCLRAGVLGGVTWLLLLLGLALALKLRPSTGSTMGADLSDGIRQSPWSVGEGYAVMVRGALLALLGILCVAPIWQRAPLVVDAAGPVLAPLVMILFAGRRLLRPRRLGLISGFGLRVPIGRWGELTGLTLALFGLSTIGALLFELAAQAAGINSHWADGVDEEMLFGGWLAVLVQFLGAVVWAPLFEELIDRGFLYTTLRRRMTVVGAAILSALLFSLPHGYSLPGLVGVGWAGFILALGYERSASLLPGIACHALHNLLATLYALFLGRW